ncbi:hypothetical protein L0152_27790, partial [bacterium]|nr:hypothetical protein [bacterium]
YGNLQCEPCYKAIRRFLKKEGISGKIIKLYSGTSTIPDGFIIHVDNPNTAISRSGVHYGVAIVIDDQELIFDNLHPQGVSRETWKRNLTFHSKEFFGKEFEESIHDEF